MSPASLAHDDTPGRAALWTGRILSGLVSAMLIMSASAKFAGGPELKANLAPIGSSRSGP